MRCTIPAVLALLLAPAAPSAQVAGGTLERSVLGTHRSDLYLEGLTWLRGSASDLDGKPTLLVYTVLW